MNPEKLPTVCAWCFPGIQMIDGLPVSHGICPKHKLAMLMEMNTRAQLSQLCRNHAQNIVPISTGKTSQGKV
jgi:hypothetical protein